MSKIRFCPVWSYAGDKVAGTASADMDGGQLNISGLVVDNTCETRVDGGNRMV